MISYNSDSILIYIYRNSGFCQECGTLPCLVSFSATSLKHIKLMEVQFSAVGTVVETLNHLTSDSLFKGTGVMKEMPGALVRKISTKSKPGLIRIPFGWFDNLLSVLNNCDSFVFNSWKFVRHTYLSLKNNQKSYKIRALHWSTIKNRAWVKFLFLNFQRISVGESEAACTIWQSCNFSIWN